MNDLQQFCSELYQIVGEMAEELDIFEAPSIVRILDDLSNASNGRPLENKTHLPFSVGHCKQELKK